ncbi:MAG TPA: hypothetical protein VHZ55_33780 [Bryobacteraceae bacterium]|nr:hypothetical protein [Bryobacteraceae bacterium]
MPNNSAPTKATEGGGGTTAALLLNCLFGWRNGPTQDLHSYFWERQHHEVKAHRRRNNG